MRFNSASFGVSSFSCSRWSSVSLNLQSAERVVSAFSIGYCLKSDIVTLPLPASALPPLSKAGAGSSSPSRESEAEGAAELPQQFLHPRSRDCDQSAATATGTCEVNPRLRTDSCDEIMLARLGARGSDSHHFVAILISGCWMRACLPAAVRQR